MQKSKKAQSAQGSDIPCKMLNDDVKIPQFGLATSFIPENELKETIKSAIMERGIRLLGTPHIASREKLIGEALRECFDSGIKREDVFVLAKCEIWDEDRVLDSLKDSLANLQLEYVDMYLLNNMVPKMDPKTLQVAKFSISDCWRQMEHCHSKGLCRSLAVGNCPVIMLLEILSYCEVKPALNIMEIHPYFNQKDVIDFNRKLGLDVASYTPLPSGDMLPKMPQYLKGLDLMKESGISDFSKKYNKSPDQLVFNWLYQQDITTFLPIKSKSELDRLSDFSFFDLQMNETDLNKFSEFNKGQRFVQRILYEDYKNIPYWQ